MAHAKYSRRTFLGALAATATAAAGIKGAAGTTTAIATGTATDAAAGPSTSGAPFEGEHQQGIVTPPQKYSVHCALDLQGAGIDQLEKFLRAVTDRARLLCAGGPTAVDGIAFPANDSGELGPEPSADNLSITVALGASVFDHRFGLAAAKPARLHAMEPFADDSLEPEQCHGDVLLQICADQRDTTLHALRDILRNSRGLVSVRWRQSGYQNDPRPSGTQRNHLGFKDGIVNPADSDYDGLVWVGDDEPDWARGGSYMVVRLISMFTEFWDRISVAEQEQIFGRDRATGGPLSGGDESTAPDYSDDASGDVIPTDAHIRLANPRTDETADQLMLRRAYNYDNGVRANGTLDLGLVFVCFQQDVERQFITVQKRLEGEPLADYIRPYGGGYFFALPGVTSPDEYLGQDLIGASTAS